ncbi:MAG: ATP-binding protein [bacterium]
MKSRGTTESGMFPGRQRRWLLWGVLVYVAILLVVCGGLWRVGQVARDRLDEALGERLTAVAVTASYLVDGDSVLVWAVDPYVSLEFIWLTSRLEQLRLDNELAEITLCDPDEFVLSSAAGRIPKGGANPFFDLDREAVQVAKEGFASASRLYRVGELYQKSAHAPVFASDGQVAAVLTVEGSADFFDSLQALRNGAILTGGLVLVFLTVMGWLLYKLQAGMERYRASVMRQENLAAMGRMTAGIAHEIRNPLGIISGSAQHLQRKLEEAGVEDEMSGYIEEEVERLDRILRSYLAFGTDDTSEIELLELNQTVKRSVKLVTDELATGGVAVDLDLTPETCRVEGDPRRLQQVLLNLLLNARDAMPDGGTVTLGLVARDGQAVLTVADTGAGLQGQSQEKLFEPFWTSKEKGSGLGLSVARRVVENLGGTLRLYDNPDRHPDKYPDRHPDRSGAVAEIKLPLYTGTIS